MRVAIITSQITYVPGNCWDFFDNLLMKKLSSIAAVFIVKNLSFDILFKICWLYSTGCNHIANTLLKNIFALPLKNYRKFFGKFGIPAIYVNSVNDREIVKWIKENDIDLLVNFRARCIFKNELLNAPKLGCINVHHGLLPNYRGLYCDLYALYENRPAGFTLHKMNEKVDDGEIYTTKIVSENGEKDYVKYLAKLSKDEALAVTNLLEYIEAKNELPPGSPNRTENIITTQMPSRKEISIMGRKGLVL